MDWEEFAKLCDLIDNKLGDEIVEYCHKIGYPTETHYDRFLIDTNKDGALCIVIVSQYSCCCLTKDIYIPANKFHEWKKFLDGEVIRLKEEKRIREEEEKRKQAQKEKKEEIVKIKKGKISS